MLIKIRNAIHYKTKEQIDILFSQSTQTNTIIKIGPNLSDHADQTIDAKQLTVIPGLIDMQVHLRVPGQEHKEDIDSGSRAASRGGFTTVLSMPNTKPTIDNKETLTKLMDLYKTIPYLDIIPSAAFTKDLKGVELSNYQDFHDLGIFALTDDGIGVEDDLVMENIFKAATSKEEYKFSLLQHCEYKELSKGHPYTQGHFTLKIGIDGQDPLAESEMIKRDIKFLKKYGGHYHVLHISTKESVELVRQAKKEGLNITCEVTPHHLVLDDTMIKEPFTHYKMNPPLRTPTDRKIIIEALLDGTIDMITTDHAPHAPFEKDLNMHEAPFGIIGLESAFGIMYTHFVRTQLMSLERLTELMCSNPKKIFNLASGDFKIGSRADIVLVDIEKSQKFIEEDILSKSKNTPFTNWNLFGMPVLTIGNGHIGHVNTKKIDL